MKKNLTTLLLTFMVAIAFAQAPPTPTIKSQTCGTVVIQVAAPPTNVTYYWQGTSCGTLNTFSTQYDTITISGTYYVRYYTTQSGGTWGQCSSIAVNVPSPPIVPGIISNLPLLSYTPPSPSQPNVIYLWQGTSCGHSLLDTSSTYIISSSGTYYLNAYDTIGHCWSTTCSSFAYVGTAQNEYQIGANVFPNPSNGLFSVELERTETNVEIKVYDLFGRVIYSEIFANFEKENIDLSNYAKGMYILNLKNKEFTLSKQIIVE